jgi:hypothetical protein
MTCLFGDDAESPIGDKASTEDEFAFLRGVNIAGTTVTNIMRELSNSYGNKGALFIKNMF